jgi:SsrA-binding protein
MENKKNSNSNTIHRNKRAFHDYSVVEQFEAGIMLTGTEVKVLRQGRSNMTDAHVTIDAHGEAWVHNLLIPQYEFGNIANHVENRKRKLLLHKKELKDIYHRIKTEGLSAIPLSLYFKGRHVKIKFGLGRGKREYDKRQDEIKKDTQKMLKKQFGL